MSGSFSSLPVRRTTIAVDRTKPSLDAIFRLETERTISNDWVIRHQAIGISWSGRARIMLL
jgi:hypothetical protein